MFAVLLLLAIPYVPALAQSSGNSWGGSLAITSDYVYRGVSLSYGHTAYQAGAHVRLPGQWQMGIWGSTLESRDGTGTPIEATVFVARSWTLDSDWNVRAGYTHYQYFGQPTLFSYDHDELFAAVVFQSQLTVGVSISPNVVRYRYGQPALRATAGAIDASWVQPLVGDWSATAGLGYYDLSALYANGYAYGHLGLVGSLGAIDLELLYVDTDSHAAYIYAESIIGSRWSATARWRF
jgi:uncharacterized protein (TIGR02001 family)